MEAEDDDAEHVQIDVHVGAAVCNLRGRGLCMVPPSTFAHAQDLVILDLSHNCLTSVAFPPQLSLPRLERMILKDNRLETLPWRLPEVMPSLQMLDVRNNQLRSLPLDLGNLPLLTTLRATGNPIALPVGFARLEHSFSSRDLYVLQTKLLRTYGSRQGRPHVSVVFLGPRQSGKTQLIRTLSDQLSVLTTTMGPDGEPPFASTVGTHRLYWFMQAELIEAGTRFPLFLRHILEQRQVLFVLTYRVDRQSSLLEVRTLLQELQTAGNARINTVRILLVGTHLDVRMGRRVAPLAQIYAARATMREEATRVLADVVHDTSLHYVFVSALSARSVHDSLGSAIRQYFLDHRTRNATLRGVMHASTVLRDQRTQITNKLVHTRNFFQAFAPWIPDGLRGLRPFLSDVQDLLRVVCIPGRETVCVDIIHLGRQYETLRAAGRGSQPVEADNEVADALSQLLVCSLVNIGGKLMVVFPDLMPACPDRQRDTFLAPSRNVRPLARNIAMPMPVPRLFPLFANMVLQAMVPSKELRSADMARLGIHIFRNALLLDFETPSLVRIALYMVGDELWLSGTASTLGTLRGALYTALSHLPLWMHDSAELVCPGDRRFKLWRVREVLYQQAMEVSRRNNITFEITAITEWYTIEPVARFRWKTNLHPDASVETPHTDAGVRRDVFFMVEWSEGPVDGAVDCEARLVNFNEPSVSLPLVLEHVRVGSESDRAWVTTARLDEGVGRLDLGAVYVAVFLWNPGFSYSLRPDFLKRFLGGLEGCILAGIHIVPDNGGTGVGAAIAAGHAGLMERLSAVLDSRSAPRSAATRPPLDTAAPAGRVSFPRSVYGLRRGAIAGVALESLASEQASDGSGNRRSSTYELDALHILETARQVVNDRARPLPLEALPEATAIPAGLRNLPLYNVLGETAPIWLAVPDTDLSHSMQTRSTVMMGELRVFECSGATEPPTWPRERGRVDMDLDWDLKQVLGHLLQIKLDDERGERLVFGSGTVQSLSSASPTCFETLQDALVNARPMTGDEHAALLGEDVVLPPEVVCVAIAVVRTCRPPDKVLSPRDPFRDVLLRQLGVSHVVRPAVPEEAAVCAVMVLGIVRRFSSVLGER